MSRRKTQRGRGPTDSKPNPKHVRQSTLAHAFIGGRARWVLVGLTAITVVAFAGLWQNDFLGWDDPLYVTANAHVLGGLTLRNIAWAFTSTDGANWHPVTWLSHMLDVQLVGANPGMHHTIGLVLHVVNASLLFGVLHRMTGALERSAFVAVLFAVHPLHVESVAWASERKDVLSTLFWMLTMLAYVAYVERPSWRRYALVVVGLVLGLMSKAMLVTLPFVLLLLDFWPLARYERSTWYSLLREKIPLFLVVLSASLTTFFVQRTVGAVARLADVTVEWRLANAVVSYVRYIGKAAWPADLAALYPFVAPINAAYVVFAIVTLLAASIGAFAVRSRRPYLTVGWFWYVGTLVPVIGLVQVGFQAMADRYMYIPLIGLLLGVTWMASELSTPIPARRVTLTSLASAVILACVIVTQRQVRVWRDGVSLWQHTIAVTEQNYIARSNLGYEFAQRGQFDEAVVQFQDAVRIAPTFLPARKSLALALARRGRIREAAEQYEMAIRFQPTDASLRVDYGLALANAKHQAEAKVQYETALRLQPGLAVAHLRLADLLLQIGQTADAIAEYNRALSLDAASPEAHNNFGVALARSGKLREAIAQFSEVLRLKPDYTDARNNFTRAGARAR